MNGPQNIPKDVVGQNAIVINGGLWVTSPDNKRSVAIYNVNGQMAIGLYGPDQSYLSAALFLDDKNRACMQFIKDGKPHSFSLEEVYELLERVKSADREAQD